jgi:hypothetical protein
MNLPAKAAPLFLESVLAVYAILWLLWPSKLLYAFTRSRKLSNNPFTVRIYRIFAGLAAVGLLWGVISELLEKRH